MKNIFFISILGISHVARHVRYLILALCLSSLAQGAKTYLEPADFLAKEAKGAKAQSITITSALKRRIEHVNGGRFVPKRVRYWQAGEKTVWILEEIGKTLPITVGYVVEKGKVLSVQVLIYRESHGYEVSYSYFTKRFRSCYLKENGQLNKRISNIAGATLSVRALTKMARTALLLDAAL